MTNNLIGVIGHKGRLGQQLLSLGCQPIECDITKIDSLATAFGKEEYITVINCAAFTDVDLCEKERLVAYNVNSYGPQNLAKVFPGKIVHISSDYIFDGDNGPYAEDDIASPINAYGFSKYFGEVALRPYMDRVLIVRTTILYDNGPKANFISSVYNQLKQGKQVRVPKTIVGNPTFSNDLAIGILSAIEKNLTGIINISGKTRMSRYDTALEIARFFDFDKSLVFDGPAWGDARRPREAGFKLDKATKHGIELCSLWEGLHAYKMCLDIDKAKELKSGGLITPDDKPIQYIFETTVEK